MKIFILKSAKAEVKTQYLLQNKVQGIVQFFPLISHFRLMYNILIPFNSKKKSSFRLSLFPTLY
jgi:ABC-type lipoprotein export system ATPase subunit